MAARSTRVILHNKTPLKLTRSESGLDHGEWTDPWYPPEIIASNSTVEWRSESDGFLTGTEGSVRYAIEGRWQGWFLIHPEIKANTGAAVTALWRNPQHLDLFMTGADGAVWSTWWEDGPGWQGWFLIHPEIKAKPGATVTALWRDPQHLDLFMTGADGAVWSTWWENGPGWQGWLLIHPEIKAKPGATIAAQWRDSQHLDLFMTGADGAVWSTWWENGPGWQRWLLIHPEIKAKPGAAVTALWRNPQHLDLFMTGTDGAVWSTWWENGPGWQGWFLIHPEIKANPGATITALWRNPQHLDLFMTGADGAVWSTWWENGPGWQGWFLIHPEIKANPGATVTALWRNPQHLDLFMTGADGAVWSAWWGVQSMYLHWDNPFISNFDRGNTYHEFVNDGFELFHVGGAGDQATAEFTLAVSVPHSVPNFLPSNSGFHFSNGYWKDNNIKLPVVELPPPFDGASITDTSQGMCGGMVFAARDFYEAGRVPPSDTAGPTNQNDPLFQYLRDRLFASWDVTRTGHDYLVFMDPAYPDTDTSFLSSLGLVEGRAFAMVVDEWPKIKNDIDNGVPSPIALIRVKSLNPGDLGENHQPLVYGYNLSGGHVTFNVYDPNYPNNNNVVLAFNKDRTDVPIQVSYTINGVEDHKPVYCFFQPTYEQRAPFIRP